MAVELKLGAAFEADAPVALFETRLFNRLFDKLLLRKHSIVVTIVDQVQNIAYLGIIQFHHARQRYNNA